MAEFPTYEQIAKDVAEKVFDEYQINGKTLREWIKIIAEQEPKADYKAFARWVADEIFSDKWELNKDAFAEIACRRLAELGMVEESGDRWVLMESEVQDADSD